MPQASQPTQPRAFFFDYLWQASLNMNGLMELFS